MSRLDSFIRRLEAQRACLDLATDRVRDRRGLIFELGLGNGRTYDHLRQRLPERRILVFERSINAHVGSLPAAADLILGPLEHTLPAAARDHAGEVDLVHSDLGCGDPTIDAELARFVGTALLPALSQGALIVSDQEFKVAALSEVPLPEGVGGRRYFFYTNRSISQET